MCVIIFKLTLIRFSRESREVEVSILLLNKETLKQIMWLVGMSFVPHQVFLDFKVSQRNYMYVAALLLQYFVLQSVKLEELFGG